MRHLRFIVLCLAAILLVSCARAATPSSPMPGGEIVAATARQIIDRSADYEGKLVKLSGKIVLECSAGCWIFLDDGTARIYVDFAPSDITIPQMVGRQITVIGRTKGSGGNVQILGEWVDFP